MVMFRLQGPVLVVEDRPPYTNRAGVIEQSARVYVQAVDPRRAADSYECRLDLKPTVGEFVDVPVRVDARSFERQGVKDVFLSVRLDEDTFLAELTAAKGAKAS